MGRLFCRRHRTQDSSAKAGEQVEFVGHAGSSNVKFRGAVYEIQKPHLSSRATDGAPTNSTPQKPGHPSSSDMTPNFSGNTVKTPTLPKAGRVGHPAADSVGRQMGHPQSLSSGKPERPARLTSIVRTDCNGGFHMPELYFPVLLQCRACTSADFQ